MESSEKKFRWRFQEHLHMNGMWLQADRKVAQQRTSRHERCPWLWAQVSHTDCFQIRGKYTRHVKTRSELGLQAVNWRLLKVYRAIQSTNLIIFLKNYYYKKQNKKRKDVSMDRECHARKTGWTWKTDGILLLLCVCVCVCAQASHSKGWEGRSLVLLWRHNIGTHLSEIRGASVVFKGKELIQITGLVRGNVHVLMSIAVSEA